MTEEIFGLTKEEIDDILEEIIREDGLLPNKIKRNDGESFEDFLLRGSSNIEKAIEENPELKGFLVKM